MAEHALADEQSINNEVHKVIGDLIKFDPDHRVRIYRTVGAFFGFDDMQPASVPETNRRPALPKDPREPHFSTHEETPPSPKDFMFQKHSDTAVERIACLAYYLTHYRNTPHFKTIDISKLNTEAAQTKLSNASDSTSKAIRAGLLAVAPKGARQLSALGEKLVEALPDRDAARALRSKNPSRRTRTKSGGNMSAVDNPGPED